jgi:hypothetical protein
VKLIDKLKLQVKDNLKLKAKPRLLFRFTAEHYKAKLSDPRGFSSLDLKPVYLELFLYLAKKYGDKLITKLEDPAKKQLAFFVS